MYHKMPIKIPTSMHQSTTGNYILDVTIKTTQAYGSLKGTHKQMYIRICYIQYNTKHFGLGDLQK